MTANNHDISVNEIIIIWNAYDYRQLKEQIHHYKVIFNKIYGFLF